MSSRLFTTITALLFTLLATHAVQAQTKQAPIWYGAPPVNTTHPSNILREGVDKLRTFLNYSNNRHPRQIMEFLGRELAPYFDFGYMAYLSSGRNARWMNQQQRIAFKNALRNAFFASMAQNLAGYQGGTVQYLPIRGKLHGSDVSLRIRIIRPDRYPVNLEFKLFNTRQGWRIYDVSANGLSAVQNYRYLTNRMAQQMGIDNMIAAMGNCTTWGC